MDKESIKTSFVIRNLVKLKNWFLNEHLIVRASISILISAIGSSSIFTLINNYALYFHAHKQGFRVPVEGVEYINLAISLLAISLIILAIGGSWILFYLLNLINKLLKNIYNKEKKIMVIPLLIFTFLYILLFAFSIQIQKNEIVEIERIYQENMKTNFTNTSYYKSISKNAERSLINFRVIPKDSTSKEKWNKVSLYIGDHKIFNDSILQDSVFSKKENLEKIVSDIYLKSKINKKINDIKSKIKITIFIFVFILTFFIFFTIVFHNEKHIKNLVGAIIAIFIISTIVLLFNQNFYKSFLGQIGFGGEIPISIEYKQADDTKGIINGRLLIRTKYSITVKKIDTGLIEEIPNERIYRLEYY